MCVLKSACVFHLCRAGIAGLLPQIRADITAHATDNPLSQAICTELLVMLELVRECVVSETKAHNHYNFVSAHFWLVVLTGRFNRSKFRKRYHCFSCWGAPRALHWLEYFICGCWHGVAVQVTVVGGITLDQCTSSSWFRSVWILCSTSLDETKNKTSWGR